MLLNNYTNESSTLASGAISIFLRWFCFSISLMVSLDTLEYLSNFLSALSLAWSRRLAPFASKSVALAPAFRAVPTNGISPPMDARPFVKLATIPDPFLNTFETFPDLSIIVFPNLIAFSFKSGILFTKALVLSNASVAVFPICSAFFLIHLQHLWLH